MRKKLGINNPKEVLKVGDTVSDIQEGKSAGVMTAAISSGTQRIEVLENEKPDFVFARLADLLKFL